MFFPSKVVTLERSRQDKKNFVHKIVVQKILVTQSCQRLDHKNWFPRKSILLIRNGSNLEGRLEFINCMRAVCETAFWHPILHSGFQKIVKITFAIVFIWLSAGSFFLVEVAICSENCNPATVCGLKMTENGRMAERSGVMNRIV